MLGLVVFLVSLPLASSAVTCGAAGATTLVVSWDAVLDTDLYYVALSSSPGVAPYALQTSATPSLTLIDLVPEKKYHITVRSHPSTENIVWGWRPPTAEVVCKTKAASKQAPHSLQRLGDAPSERSIAVTWNPALAPNGTAPNATHQVGVRFIGGTWRWELATTARQHELTGLAPGSLYEVAVRDEATGELSELMQARTSAVGAVHTLAYRISEYSMDVDFLENHDAVSWRALKLGTHNAALAHVAMCLCACHAYALALRV